MRQQPTERASEAISAKFPLFPAVRALFCYHNKATDWFSRPPTAPPQPPTQSPNISLFPRPQVVIEPRWSPKGRSWSSSRGGVGDGGGGAASSTNRKAASPNFYICVRFLSHHSSAGSWVQPPQRSLHFPAHLRCCCCAGSSSPCCSSGWAFYAISRPAAFIRPHSAASATRRLAAFAECVSALFFPGVVVVAALVVLVGQRARSIAALIEAILNNNQL